MGTFRKLQRGETVYEKPGCEYCRKKGNPSWMKHPGKNAEGKIICYITVNEYISSKIACINITTNTTTFIFYNLILMQKN
jgi:hypothetical protein